MTVLTTDIRHETTIPDRMANEARGAAAYSDGEQQTPRACYTAAALMRRSAHNDDLLPE